MSSFTHAVIVIHFVFLYIQLLMKQSVWFNNIRLMANYLSVWKWRYQLKQEENGKTDIALWHWSLVLQKKVRE